MGRADPRRDRCRGITLAGLLVAALLLCSAGWADAAQASAQAPTVGYVVRDFAAVHAGPGAHHEVLWRLYAGSQVAVIGETLDARGMLWYRIRLWNSEEGWIEAAAVAFDLALAAPHRSGR